MPLPDVPQTDYDAFQADRFSERTSQRIAGLSNAGSFLQSSGARIATLGGFEPVEVASTRSPILGGPVQPPTLPNLPQLPPFTPPTLPFDIPQPPAPTPTPAPTPRPIPPPGAVPTPGVGAGPVAPGPAPGAPVAPAVQPPVGQPQGAPVPAVPTVPMVPGPVPRARPPTFADESGGGVFSTQAGGQTSNPQASPQEVEGYIRQAAAQRGIDPDTAIAVANSEGGMSPARRGTFATGSSWWPFQLHYGGRGYEQFGTEAGMGNDFTAKTGIQPGDPNGWQASVDYALDRAKMSGWGGWYGARSLGITGFKGIGEAPITAAAVQGPAGTTAARVSVQPTALSTSQFDPQLTAAEAIAACGPAAAVRFLQAYGRNPTLREATDLAATVGWTQERGMAGITSEQALLKKLGTDTRLVSGGQWSEFAREAQTGNPVIISTPGHYFLADGYNPETGAFHVGRSGMDLRRGKEWMTPAEMEAVMGPAQGALFASNPGTNASSTTVADTPQGLDDVRNALRAQIGAPNYVRPPHRPGQEAQPVGAATDPQVQSLDQAVEQAYIPSRRRAQEQQSATTPVTLAAGAPPPGPPSGNPFDQFGQTMANALRNLFGGGGGPPDDQRRRDEQAQQQSEAELAGEAPPRAYEPFDTGLNLTPEQLADTTERRTQEMMARARRPLGPEGPDLVGRATGIYLEPPKTLEEATDRAIADIQRRGVPSPGPTGALGILQPGRSLRELNPLSKGPEGSVLEDVLGAVPRILGGGGELGGEINPIARAAQEAGEARLASAAAPGIALGGRGELVLPSNVHITDPEVVLAGARSAGNALSRSRPGEAWASFVRQFTDENVDLNQVQAAFQARAGRKLNDRELVAFQARVDPSHRSLIATENAIGDALRSMRPVWDDFEQVVENRVNTSIGEGLAARTERQFLEGGIAPRTEEALKEAQADLAAAQKAHDEARRTWDAINAGEVRTRESISLDAAHTRVEDAQARLEAATDAARQAQADAAHEAVMQGRGANLVTPAEQRDLYVAENNAAVLNRRYDALYRRNPDDPYLVRLARQLGRAEDRVARLRRELGETTAGREEALAERAVSAAGAAEARPTVSATPELAAAKVRLRFEQQNLERLQQNAARGMTGLQDRIARAQKRLADAQRDVDVATADLPAAARAQGEAVLYGRKFPNNATYESSQQKLREIQARHSPEEWARMNQAADTILQDFRNTLLEESQNSGLISEEMANGMRSTYRDWAPTNYLDFQADDTGRGMPVGSRLSVGDRGLHAYTDEGVSGEAESRLAAMLREADMTFQRGQKNRTVQALIDAQGNQPGGLRQIAPDMKTYMQSGGENGPMLRPGYVPKPGKNEMTITAWVDGQKQQWLTDNPMLHAAIEKAPSAPLTGLAGLLGKGASITRELATQRNPLWLSMNMARDLATYLPSMASQGSLGGNVLSGGIQLGPAMATALATPQDDPNRNQKVAAALLAGYGTRSLLGKQMGLGPNLMAEYLRAMPDAFAGMMSERYLGKGTQEFLLGGGGMKGGGMFGRTRTQEGALETLENLRRNHIWEVRKPEDLKRFADNVAFGWVKHVGNRLELVPRVAAMRVAQQRGEGQLASIMRGRNVTLDFDRGGKWIREANRIIPFLNAGVQGLANMGRLAKENPAGFLAAGTALIGAPAMYVEAHNNSSPELARDYADVPEYLKNQGLVIMLGGQAGVDKDGNRRPNMLFVPLGPLFMPFAMASREAINRLQGREGRSAGEIGLDLLRAESPLSFANPSDLAFGSFGLPGVSTVGQLAMNQDLFRGSTIANTYSDENASQLGKALAGPLTDLISQGGRNANRVHPSQVDFAVRDTLGGLGNVVLGASNIGQPPRSTALSDQPIVGGAAGRFIRSTGGQQYEDVTQSEAMLAQDVRQRLRAVGDNYEPTQVRDEIKKVPLRRAEQVEYQRLTNQYFNEKMRRYMANPRFDMSETVRQKLRDKAMTAARERAGSEILKQIRQSGSSLIERRKNQSSAY